MSVNNFKELEKLQEKEYNNLNPDVRTNLVSSMGLFRFIGDIFDLFIPKVMDMFIKISGGSPKQNVSHRFDQGDHQSGLLDSVNRQSSDQQEHQRNDENARDIKEDPKIPYLRK